MIGLGALYEERCALSRRKFPCLIAPLVSHRAVNRSRQGNKTTRPDLPFGQVIDIAEVSA
jgi:hypothetical protein